MTSTRLPGKVLKPIVGKPVLALMIERVRAASSLDNVIVATTVNRIDNPIVELADELGVACYRGSENDVLGRVLGAAQTFNVDVIVELTGDCPLIDPSLIDDCVAAHRTGNAVYVSNMLTRAYPDGMDVQVFATAILQEIAELTDDDDDREHVSLYIYNHPERYKLQNVPAPPELTDPDLGLTLDTSEDLELITRIYEALYPNDPNFSLSNIMALLRKRAELTRINKHVRRKSV